MRKGVLPFKKAASEPRTIVSTSFEKQVQKQAKEFFADYWKEHPRSKSETLIKVQEEEIKSILENCYGTKAKRTRSKRR